MEHPSDPDHPRLTRLRAVLYGADYNPEQWPDELVAEDVELMSEAGVNVVSLGIFSWAKLEPRRDDYHFEWLDRVIAQLHDGGIGVNLATPTAAPPAWLTREHPEILPVDSRGTTLLHGSRRHVCPNSGAYHERAAAIAEAIATRYGDHPAVIMWHVDNEYAGEVADCYCAASVEAFRAWLMDRYGDIDELNRAWSTAFWSQACGDWEEVGPPRPTPGLPNPTQVLDWRRFFSDAWLRCFDEQADILRRHAPAIPVTTNFMGFFPSLDYHEWARHEDLVSNDAYPDTYEPDWMVDAAMVDDLMRSLGAGRPWALMEQAPANIQWRERNPTKRPGVMRRRSLQAVARGADAIQFFQWRASLGGSERFHSAMVPHAGRETRTWREVVELGSDLSRLAEVSGSRSRAEVAILFDWHNGWLFEAGGLPSVDLDPQAAVRDWYAALFGQNVLVDFAHPAADLSAYKLVIAPQVHITDADAIASMRAVVEGGRTLVLTYFSGIADADARVYPGPYPAPFSDLLGAAVEEYTALPLGTTLGVDLPAASGATAREWVDVIRLDGAEAVATYRDDYVAGRAAVTRHRGDGEAWYVGTRLDPAALASLCARICAAAGVGGHAAPSGVEIVERHDRTRTWTFVLNHGSEPTRVGLGRPGREILRGSDVTGPLEVAAGDVAVVRTEAIA